MSSLSGLDSRTVLTCMIYMSRSTRKPTLLTLRNVSTRISLSMLTRIDTFRLLDFLFQESLLFTSIALRRNVSVRISLRGLRRLIWIDALRRVNNVGFLVERLIFIHES